VKQNKVKLYAKALAEIALKKHSVADEKKITENFLDFLVKNGAEKKAKEIVELAENIVLAKQGKNKIIFQTARKTTASQKKLLQSLAKEGDIIKEKISPELIAGVKIIINDSRQFDASMQKKLQNIFSK
jgi:F0F1-type ATP synthase delta subunit